ncbi:hypothetical protein BR63_08185 [Thermanaerosceptrum fracticalcis]|uniref:Type I restriction enzyme R protein N-terminal domain-containing protein n=1 Tax=Thermanaerosceptrum fracticalcis TaxID=1712410 RepID=A0A7G6E2I7_THEFR|nr:hypothetical protein [Thermanaerosceptrum fracticalcis]QNB46291.1 hypothetical protein BR63_08185 [Thermanaerosceptrum fracticalcis]
MPNEADTCRRYVLPKFYAAGWTDDQISEQKTFTDGKIVVAGNKATRQKPKRADYILNYTRDLMISVVEAKATYKSAGDGLQQAMDYAQTLGLKFAYSTRRKKYARFSLKQIVSYIDNLCAKISTFIKIQNNTKVELDLLLPSILARAFNGDLL